MSVSVRSTCKWAEEVVLALEVDGVLALPTKATL